MSQDTRTIVLLGGGHAHVFVLMAFGLKPEPGVRLILITKDLAAAYSGMLPGYVAGHYTLDQCHIELERLARFAGAELIHSSAIGVDRQARQVFIDGGGAVAYDVLSIDVGITPDVDDIAGAYDHALVVKPVSVFAQKWRQLEISALQAESPKRLAVIGGGAAGVELILAARHRLRTLSGQAGLDPATFHFTLIARSAVLPSHNACAQDLARWALAKAGVHVVESDPATAVSADAVTLASGRRVACQAVMISTKARAPEWFRNSGLPCDARGFLSVRPTLQAVDDGRIFAVGDCASIVGHPLEKAGVFAVRQGPIVATNLRRVVRREELLIYTPQRHFLTLVSLGDKSAIASRGRLSVMGSWAWRWKDMIDRAFMDNFNHLPEKPVHA